MGTWARRLPSDTCGSSEMASTRQMSAQAPHWVHSQGFRRSLPLAEKLFPDPFALFEALAAYYRENGYETNKPSVRARYEIFSAFVRGRMRESGALSAKEQALLPELIRFDQQLHVHPSRRMQAEDTFDFGEGPVLIRFDYSSCSPVNGEAAFTMTEKTGRS